MYPKQLVQRGHTRNTPEKKYWARCQNSKKVETQPIPNVPTSPRLRLGPWRILAGEAVAPHVQLVQRGVLVQQTSEG